MPDAKPERRSRQRLAVRVPVSIQSRQGRVQASGYTRDLSTSGIFLYTDSQIGEGSELEMILILPTELTGGEKRWVCCRASVVRVEVGILAWPRGSEAWRFCPRFWAKADPRKEFAPFLVQSHTLGRLDFGGLGRKKPENQKF